MVLDPSSAMLDKARQQLQRLPDDAQRRVTLVEADGENADEAVNGQRFAAPALEQRWDDALTSFDTRGEIGVLGVPTRADTVEELSELVRRRGVEPVRWYGVWLFVDWLDFGGAELDPNDSKQVAAVAVELEASRRDPYRQLSRVFRLVGRKGPG